MISPGRLILISRPLAYPLQIAIVLAGVVSSSRSQLSLSVWITLLYFTLPSGLIIYGVNDIADRDSDRRNKRKGGIHGAILEDHETKALSSIIGWTAVLGPLCFLLIGRPLNALLLLVLTGISYVYSVRPWRLKVRPLADTLCNAAGAVCIFMTGYWANQSLGSAQPPAAHILAVIFLFTAGVHALGAVADYTADKASGDNTISVALGRPLTSLFASACLGTCYFLIGTHHLVIGIYILGATLLALLTLTFTSVPFMRRVLLAIVVGFPIAYALQLALF